MAVTRIVAGLARGRPLGVPAGRGTRPTSDRAREALFSTLQSLVGLSGARFLDLYAGSGAVGLEALSRGAGEVVLVESDASAARVIGDNLAALALPGARVVRDKVERFLDSMVPEVFDVVFADPPYQRDGATMAACLARLCEGWTRPGSVLVVERPTRAGQWTWPNGLESLKSRRYGEGTLWYGRRS